MRILFAITDTGWGHRAAAQAIEAAVTRELGSVASTAIIDVYQDLHVPVLQWIPRAYQLVSRRGISLYNLLYRTTDRPYLEPFIAGTFHSLSKRRIVQLLDRVKPDLVVVCHPLYMTHQFSRARSELRAKFSIATVVTDPVMPHRSWVADGADVTFVLTDEAEDKLKAHGKSRQQFVRVSYPVHPDFLQGSSNIAEARSILNIDQDADVILLAGGMAGTGSMSKFVVAAMEMAGQATLLVAAGANQSLRREVARFSPRTVRVLPQGSPLRLPMQASTVVIAKGGPATIFEAAAIGTPLALTAEIGRQEYGNIALAERHGIGIRLQRPQDIRETIEWARRRRHQPRFELVQGALEIAKWAVGG